MPFAQTSGPQNALATVTALALLCCAPLSAAVQVREEQRAGRTVYAISNSHLRAVVDPADGGSVSLSDAAGPSDESWATAVLVSDRFQGRPCAYRMEDRTLSESVVALTLTWKHRSGFEVEKTVSLLEGQQVVRVNYGIENGSHSNERLHPTFRFEASGGSQWETRVRHESGLARSSGSSLAREGGLVLDYVSWFSAADPTGRGFATLASNGALGELLLWGPRATGAIEMQGTTVLVPAGRSLTAQFVLAPFRDLGPLVNATEQLLCSMDVEWAGQTSRFNLRMMPLSDLGAGVTSLRLVGVEGALAESIGGSSARLTCGKAVAFPFYCRLPEPGTYRTELLVPGLKQPVTLGECSRHEDVLRLSPVAEPPFGQMTFGEVEGWLPAEPPENGAGTPPTGFFGARGEPLERLRVDVGVGEMEALVIGLRADDTAGSAAEVRLTDLVTARGARRLPASSVQLFRILGPQGRATASIPGLVVPIGGPPWKFRRLAGMRLRVPEVGPGSYLGTIQLAGPRRSASMPMQVRVWPVRRPRPGLVRLHVNDLPCNVLADVSSYAPPWESLRQHEVSNATVEAYSLLRAEGVKARTGPGSWVPLREWLKGRDQAAGKAGLPALDFTATNGCLERILLSGMTDLTVCGDVSLDGLAVPGAPAGERSALTEWFWREFATHLRTKGFGNPYFMGRAASGAAALDEEWFAAARLLRAAGWSVCGPYELSAANDEVLQRLAALSRLLVFRYDASADLEAIRKMLPEGTAVGVWVSGLPANFTARRARQYAHELARGGADLIAFGSVLPPHGASGAGPAGGRAQPIVGTVRDLNSLAWEGVRDGLDEVNYLRMLDWYREAAGRAPPSDASSRAGRIPSKRALLERFADLAEGDTPDVVSLYWNDLLLVDNGRPRAVIAIDPDYSDQQPQAEMLKEIIRFECGVALPILRLQAAPPVAPAPIVLLCGSPGTNSLLRQLASGRADLAWRLEKNGHMFAEFERGGAIYLAVMAAEPAQWGRPVMDFKMLLRREGGWVLR